MQTPASATWRALGTNVLLRVLDPGALPAARERTIAELEAIDLACSRFRDDSELATLNASREVDAGPLLIEALELAVRAARLTDGVVDPTVGRALELVGYDRDFSLLTPAPSQTPAPTVTARPCPGWQAVKVDRRTGRVRIPAGVRLDLGATAKAWAADRCAAAAAAAGGCGALVSLGGDVAVSGRPPARGWSIHVTDDHRSHWTAPGQTVAIRSGGVATSSTTVRRWSHRGLAAHHIIDPTTGAPAHGPWRTVSVAAGSCADANIAATAALVLGDDAADWLAAHGLPARLVAHDGDVVALAGWPGESTLEAAA